MTVEWSTYAQSLTDRPVKGMLTGPVTMLAWSFVRDDQPLGDTADQVALALRDEVVDLEAAGVRVIQVDEPALRETLPLRAADQPAYLDWAVGAFRLATCGVADDTQIHTHMCYSEFGEVITAIDALDADVTSIEASRSKMEVARRPRRDRLPPRGRPWCVGHPLTAGALACRGCRGAAFGSGGGPGRAAVGEPRLRPEDPWLCGGASVARTSGRRRCRASPRVTRPPGGGLDVVPPGGTGQIVRVCRDERPRRVVRWCPRGAGP